VNNAISIDTKESDTKIGQD